MKISFQQGKKCTEQELNVFLSSFNLIDSLAKVCLSSFKQYLGYCSSDIAFRLVNYATDDNQKYMTEENLIYAKQMSHYLFQQKTDTLGLDEAYLMVDYQQHKNNEIIKYDLARTLCIYDILWHEVKEAKGILINDEIEKETGLNLNALLALSYAFGNNAKNKGHFAIYKKSKIDTLSKENQEIFSIENQNHFLEYCCISYDDLRKKTTKDRVFLLEKSPVIRTDTVPVGCDYEPFMVPSFENYIKKATTNLFYSLSSRFEEANKGNKFKSAFGYVFEVYVKKLFEECLTSWQIDGEDIYGKKYEGKKIDFFISKDDKLILVEVKHASLYLNSIKSCKNEDLRENLNQTLRKGVDQITKAEETIFDLSNPTLSKFKHVRFIQRLIVTYLPLKGSNSIIKNILKEEIQDYPKKKDFHIINIQELEMLLSNQKESESLFDLLNYKELNSPSIDFNEYIDETFKDFKYEIDFLEKINKEFRSQFNL